MDGYPNNTSLQKFKGSVPFVSYLPWTTEVVVVVVVIETIRYPCVSKVRQHFNRQSRPSLVLLSRSEPVRLRTVDTRWEKKERVLNRSLDKSRVVRSVHKISQLSGVEKREDLDRVREGAYFFEFSLSYSVDGFECFTHSQSHSPLENGPYPLLSHVGVEEQGGRRIQVFRVYQFTLLKRSKIVMNRTRIVDLTENRGRGGQGQDG